MDKLIPTWTVNVVPWETSKSGSIQIKIIINFTIEIKMIRVCSTSSEYLLVNYHLQQTVRKSIPVFCSISDLVPAGTYSWLKNSSEGKMKPLKSLNTSPPQQPFS